MNLFLISIVCFNHFLGRVVVMLIYYYFVTNQAGRHAEINLLFLHFNFMPNDAIKKAILMDGGFFM